MRLAPRNPALRIASYLLVALITGAAIIAVLSGNGDEQPTSISSDTTAALQSDTATEAVDTANQETTAPTEPPTSTTAAPVETTEPVADDPDLLSLPSDAAEMAAELTKAELAVRDESLTNVELDGWGRRQQALYRHLSFNSEWADAVLADVDPAAANAVALNWKARMNLSSLVNTEKLHDELPAWRVNPPLPPEELIGYYKQAEQNTGVQWEFVAAINLIETRMGRIEGISTAGAVGPMQFLPTTWAECCDGDPSIPADAIAGAAKYLTDRGGPENMDKAIFGYNNSNYYVEAVTSYANVMMENERAYYGYHAWEIYFLSTEGLIRIPVGYEQLEPITAVDWLAANPDTLFSQ